VSADQTARRGWCPGPGHSASGLNAFMASRSRQLQSIAEAEVQRTLAALPVELRDRAEPIPLVLDGRSVEDLDADGVGDTLGLFVGENIVEAGQGSGGLPAQIILYLENLWWEADQDEAIFRREVRATLLHELGHYLGLEEIDLEERGL
jgi:predicted Zn-dependent protease with MMP-like domain